MNLVEAGKIELKEAAEKIGKSYRQTKRIWKNFQEKGVKGLIHGNIGKPSHNKTPDSLKNRILYLSQKVYGNFNDSHFQEKLAEGEGIHVSRETVRRIRREAGILPKRKRRPPKHRKRRERKVQEGLMVIWDGSPHYWFGKEQPPCCLMLALDDATGAILAARFFPFEGSVGYLWLLRQIVSHYGIPISIYQDRHSALHRNDEYWTLEEQLAGRQELTQVGRALENLGIRQIFALSAQAKGRIERMFGTLQDRLGAELDLAGIKTPSAGNKLLPRLIPKFNRRFSVPSKQAEKAWRPLTNNLDIDRVISFRYPATVGKDNTVRLGGLILDIPPGPKRRSFAKAKVEARQLLDGSWRIYYQSQLIGKYPSTTLREPIRALARNKPKTKGTKSYEWLYLNREIKIKANKTKTAYSITKKGTFLPCT
jgi:transposase